jgi:ABC-type branched-subunit amino acid transport system ATPase component
VLAVSAGYSVVIRKINERDITIFLVEQNVRQTLEIAHYGYMLSKGRVVAAGTPRDLGQDSEVHRAYFGWASRFTPAGERDGFR